LKKQSQFSEGRIVVSICMKYSYGQFCAFLRLKNKAKQSQFIRVSDGFVIACIEKEKSRAFPVTRNFV
jgi:hypothetical protein